MTREPVTLDEISRMVVSSFMREATDVAANFFTYGLVCGPSTKPDVSLTLRSVVETVARDTEYLAFRSAHGTVPWRAEQATRDGAEDAAEAMTKRPWPQSRADTPGDNAMER